MTAGDVFISAVSSEFGKARGEIASNLRAKGWRVTEQTDFRSETDSDTLLRFLHDHIYAAERVVCILGKRSGACPKPNEVEQFAHLRILPDGIAQASYTQWELFFARYYNKRLSVYPAADDYPPDEAKGSDVPGLQTSYVDFVKKLGLQRVPFSTADQLRAAVLTEDWERKLTKPQPKPGKPIVLPYPSIGHLFKGRDEFLKQLHDSLTHAGGGKTAIFNALYGMGGVGKSRAAVEYARHYENDYSALLFVIGDSPENLRRNLAGLSATLVPELETTEETAHVKAVIDWLNRNRGWLLILDNLDTQESLAEAERIMAQCSGGHVIITSRLSNFPGEVQPLELGVLDRDDAAAFLLERTGGRRRTADDDEAKASEIAEELGYLALALEQAAAYIGARKLTFAQYLDQWRANREKVMAWSDPNVTHYPRAVAVTWQTSVDQLTPAGRRLLERLAWLAPEPIPDFLLDVPIPGQERENENLLDAFADLAGYSLVTHDAEGPFFLIHRLVQDVTRRSLNETTRLRRVRETLTWINEAFRGAPTEVRNWIHLEPLSAHARIIANYADTLGSPDPTTTLMNQVALLLQTKALYAEAEPIIRRALAIDEEKLGPDHPMVSVRVNNLAQLLHDTNRIGEAEKLMRRALSSSEKNFGPDDPRVAGALNNLSVLLQATDRHAEAEPLLHRAIEIFEMALGPDDPELARTLNNLAQLLKATNRAAEAESLSRRSLAIYESNFGPDDPMVASVLNNIARSLQSAGRFSEAESTFRRAITIHEKSLGSMHPTVAIGLNNLALLLMATNDLDEAELLMRRHLAIFVNFKQKTGHQHPHFNQAIINYGGLLVDMGKTDSEIKATIESVLNGPI